MLRNLVLTLIAFTVLLSGCITGPDLPDDDAPEIVVEPVMPPLDFKLNDCDAIIGMVPVPAERLEAEMPEGFTAVIPPELGLPPDPRGDAVLGVEIFNCADYERAYELPTESHTTVIPQALYASYWTFVQPPADIARDDVMFSFYKWDTAIPDAQLRAELVAAGLPVQQGAETVTAKNPLPTGGSAFNTVMRWDDASYFATNGVAAADATMGDGSFIEYTETPDGIATWFTNFTNPWGYQGTGYLKTSTDSWGYTITGQERSPAYFMFARMSLDTSVTLPEVKPEVQLIVVEKIDDGN